MRVRLADAWRTNGARNGNADEQDDPREWPVASELNR
jgi:hypothetical protein